MQYVALVECLQLVRDLAAKAGTVAAAVVASAEAAGKGGSKGGASAASPAAVKGMEELAHALGALEALLSEGAGDTSASGERRERMLSLLLWWLLCLVLLMFPFRRLTALGALHKLIPTTSKLDLVVFTAFRFEYRPHVCFKHEQVSSRVSERGTESGA